MGWRAYRVLSLSLSLMLACACMPGVSAEPVPVLRIGTWEHDNKDVLAVSSQAILSQAYAELRQPLEFVELPLRRAFDMLLNGHLDGNLVRIGDLAREYPALFRVETPIVFVELRMYTRNPKIKPENWSQLAGLRVGYPRGALLIERRLAGASRRVEATSLNDSFQLLGRDVVDVVLAVEPRLSPPSAVVLAANGERLDLVLESVPLYHYLAGRHREFGLRLDTVLKRMHNSGELDGIRAKALKDAQ